jgi:hypothetical protein
MTPKPFCAPNVSQPTRGACHVRLPAASIGTSASSGCAASSVTSAPTSTSVRRADNEVGRNGGRSSV